MPASRTARSRDPKLRLSCRPGRLDLRAICFTMPRARPLTGVRIPLAFEQLRRPAAAPILAAPVIPGSGPGRGGSGRGRFDNISRAFSHRNYRIYTSGNGISLIGCWLQRVAVGWLTWTLTHSGHLARARLARRFPAGAGSQPVRRRPRRSARPGQHHPHHPADRLRAGEPARGSRLRPARSRSSCCSCWCCCSASPARVAQPARLALIPTLVDRAALPSALAINSIVFNLARFIGPAIAGILIADVSDRRRLRRQCGQLHRVSDFAGAVCAACRPLPVAARQNAIRASLEAYRLCQPASRHRADAAAVRRDDDRHPRLCRAVPRLCRQRLRPRRRRAWRC